MKKRTLALLMTLFVVSAFTGCAKDQGTTDQTPVQSVENKEADDNNTDDTSPVSYTHLDVYKRQTAIILDLNFYSLNKSFDGVTKCCNNTISFSNN